MSGEITFDLPEHLIAQAPARPRDHARLLVYDRKTKSITDSVFYKLDDFLPVSTTLILNDSKVEKCRLFYPPEMTGTKKGIELFIIETINPTTIRTMVRPGRRFKDGASLKLNGVIFTVSSIDENGLRTIKLSHPIDSSLIEPYLLTPLPPYIAQNEDLSDEYQNVYANPLGSKAAPTAGLHFTDELLENIKKKHDVATLTLHVGLGTFAPLKDENYKTGKLHSETFEISPKCAEILNTSTHITAVGTTSVRTLESARHNRGDSFKATSGDTDIFILPGYTFKAVDAMITNFHLPSTSLLLLVAAFIAEKQPVEEAKNELLRIYNHAIEQQYRFYSFGDAMLIL